MISRDGFGVSPAAQLDAVKNPLNVITNADGTITYVGNNATVILNSGGKVVTAWANNSGGWRIIPKQ